MDKCPRCENEKLKEEYKYCPICGAILEYEVVEVSVEILKAMLIKYKAYRCEDAEEETLIPSVIGALVVAINALERAAQEVPVQEQLILKEAEEIIATLSWRMGGINPKSALKFDKETKTILIDEEKLMDILQMITPTQKRRSLKIVKKK